jgi:hypothetical protein
VCACGDVCHPGLVSVNLLAATIAAALPLHGTVVPGRSLGGIRLGDPPSRVTTLWGRRFGVCSGCLETTWYFNYVRYAPQGLGVEFRRKRVVALFTLWSPTGWHTAARLTTGDPAARVSSLYGPLPSVACNGYTAFLLRRASAVTAFYVVREKVWGFGVSRPSVAPCR